MFLPRCRHKAIVFYIRVRESFLEGVIYADISTEEQCSKYHPDNFYQKEQL
jgi:hypothetical protein